MLKRVKVLHLPFSGSAPGEPGVAYAAWADSLGPRSLGLETPPLWGPRPAPLKIATGTPTLRPECHLRRLDGATTAEQGKGVVRSWLPAP